MFTNIILLADSVHFFEDLTHEVLRCSTVYIFFFNLIKMDVMKNERNKTLKVVDGFKFRFHKLLKNDIQR